MGKSRKMAKVITPKQDKKLLMTQKLDSSREVFKPKTILKPQCKQIYLKI